VNIGVLGGTFDPIHMGHLIVAEEARVRLGLREVLFVPAGDPWLKSESNVTAAVHRVEMVRRAIAGNPYFGLCTLEVERSGPSYTVDTMVALRQELGHKAGLHFILGKDTLPGLPVWKEPVRLLELCTLVVAPRLGSKDWQHLESSIRGLRDRVIELDMPVIGISSSGIRERVAQGLSIRYLVPQDVEAYITERKLYAAS
jgi:nicotinate-nucleotide adenylyltransferase